MSVGAVGPTVLLASACSPELPAHSVWVSVVDKLPHSLLLFPCWSEPIVEVKKIKSINYKASPQQIFIKINRLLPRKVCFKTQCLSLPIYKMRTTLWSFLVPLEDKGNGSQVYPQLTTLCKACLLFPALSFQLPSKASPHFFWAPSSAAVASERERTKE